MDDTCGATSGGPSSIGHDWLRRCYAPGSASSGSRRRKTACWRQESQVPRGRSPRASGAAPVGAAARAETAWNVSDRVRDAGHGFTTRIEGTPSNVVVGRPMRNHAKHSWQSFSISASLVRRIHHRLGRVACRPGAADPPTLGHDRAGARASFSVHGISFWQRQVRAHSCGHRRLAGRRCRFAAWRWHRPGCGCPR